MLLFAGGEILAPVEFVHPMRQRARLVQRRLPGLGLLPGRAERRREPVERKVQEFQVGGRVREGEGYNFHALRAQHFRERVRVRAVALQHRRDSLQPQPARRGKDPLVPRTGVSREAALLGLFDELGRDARGDEDVVEVERPEAGGEDHFSRHGRREAEGAVGLLGRQALDSPHEVSSRTQFRYGACPAMIGTAMISGTV